VSASSAGVVSRETDGPSNDLLGQVFGPRIEAVRRYANLLATVGVERGLIGPREIPRIWSRHILNCAVVAPALRTHASVCDLGSGAGLPGVVLALARPDLHITLLEPMLRRATFLSEVVAELDIAVEVVRARAETARGSMRVNYVTARAVAPLDRLVSWALPLCLPGGELVALKGASAAEELERVQPVLRRLGVGPGRIDSFGQGVVTPLTTAIRIASARLEE
jgi:16S rRNA (guanine527-N7)-methyltransferase